MKQVNQGVTLEMTKPESGAEFPKFRRSGTLRVSGKMPVAPVLGERRKTQVQAALVRRGTWELAPSAGWKSSSFQVVDEGFSLGSGRKWTPGALGTLGELGRSHSGDRRGSPKSER